VPVDGCERAGGAFGRVAVLLRAAAVLGVPGGYCPAGELGKAGAVPFAGAGRQAGGGAAGAVLLPGVVSAGDALVADGQLQQFPGCLRAVQTSVGDNGALVGAFGAAVRMQSWMRRAPAARSGSAQASASRWA
jgi:hypothetical protein